MSLPSAVHVSSIIKRGASGDWEICFSVVFWIGCFARYVYVYICILYFVVFVVFFLYFVLCRMKKKE